MRITRMKLINFIGIKSGLDKDELEIFFPEDSYPITMISGGNGSGKTSILSQLTSFKDSFDDRKKLILDGKEGIKEIDIDYDGKEYKIKHVMGEKSLSFISEDGIELNENGGVRTFEDIIKNKFSVTKDYFKIGKIGSNTTNFIQFPTTQRKAYINTLIEPVKKYLDSFTIVKDKFKLNEQKIKQISNDLSKFDDSITVNKKLEDNEKSRVEVEKNIILENNSITKLELEIENIDALIKDVDYPALKAEITTKETTYKKMLDINKEFELTYSKMKVPTIDKKIVSLTKEIESISTKLTTDKGLLQVELSNKASYQNSITKAQSQLKTGIKLDTSLIKTNLEKMKVQKLEYDKYFKESKIYAYISKHEAATQSHLDTFKTFMELLSKNYSELNETTLEPHTKNIDLFFGKDFTSFLNNQQTYIRETTQNNQDTLDTKNNEYSTKLNNLNKLEILKQRPKACTIDSCPFIADALKYKDLPKEINNLEEEIKNLKLTSKDLEDIADKFTDLKIMYSHIALAFSKLDTRQNNVIQYYAKTYGKITDTVKMPLNDLNRFINETITTTEECLLKLNEYRELVSNIDVETLKLTSSEDSESTQKYFSQEIQDNKNNISLVDILIKKYTDNIKVLSDELETKQNEKILFETYKNNLGTNQKTKTEITTLKSELSDYEKLAKSKSEKIIQKETKSKKLLALNADKDAINKQITNLKVAEATIKTLEKNKTEVEESHDLLTTIKNSLDPKSGIPLIFVQSYLDGIVDIANDLLNIAYNGKFEIKFIADENDFFIQVRSGDNIIDDIRSASQGEIALTTISISLALIERSLSKYNILYLDEIDGPLDEANRQSFLDIITKQIERLGIEQVFIISHNNVFDTCPMNLILLNDSPIDVDNTTFMANKKIIYNIAD